MSVLRQAFNMVTRLHSRAAILKRTGSPSLYSPIRITPSSYFRELEGPSAIVIKGREFLIPIDTISGTPNQTITFVDVDGVAKAPTDGTFDLTYGMSSVVVVGFGEIETAVDLQVALRAITGLELVTVTGDLTTGFTVVFVDVQDPELLAATLTTGNELDANVVIQDSVIGTPWTTMIKRGDKIIDTLGHLAIDEITEVVDLGGDVMAYRVRCE